MYIVFYSSSRYTKLFAKEAKSVISVDFMEHFIEKSKEENGHLSNIEFIVSDVMKLQLPPDR